MITVKSEEQIVSKRTSRWKYKGASAANCVKRHININVRHQAAKDGAQTHAAFAKLLSRLINVQYCFNPTYLFICIQYLYLTQQI